jgi:2-amino-4-hydroxy-6-hydroxymethyldihydropteridine diphosphokinase
MRYAIAVGSNRGDRRAILDAAAELLAADGRVRIERRSRLIENPAVGGPPGQGDFLNGAWIVATALGPHQLLMRLLRIEAALGRVRGEPDAPRTCDLDLLLAEDGRVLSGPVLTLPHPRMCDRAFVLEPLAEVAGAWRHPITGLRIDELWRRLQTTA